MKQQFPDYTNCIANLANSILKDFGIDEERKGMPSVDFYLKKSYKNVVVLLLDGMGSCILQRNLDRDGFFNSHLVETYSSVFPPTTVAATISMASGLTPYEHSWLGWDCYYPQIDKNVTVFLNRETGTDRLAAEYPVAWTYCGYKSVAKKIRESGKKAFEVIPFIEPFPDSFDKVCRQIQSLARQPDRKSVV